MVNVMQNTSIQTLYYEFYLLQEKVTFTEYVNILL